MNQTNYYYTLPIKAWNEDDRPREKLMTKGKASLSNAEILAILIGSGTKNQSAVELSKLILDKFENNLSLLSKQSIKDLMQFKGIGEAKAITIAAALELGRRRKEEAPTERKKITCSKDVYDYLYADMVDLDHEEFWVILLNRNNVIIDKQKISSGGISATVVDSRLILKYALNHKASMIVLAHNHPSGNTEPSKADIDITNKLKESAKLMDMMLNDHIIFTENAYFSFYDKDML